MLIVLLRVCAVIGFSMIARACCESCSNDTDYHEFKKSHVGIIVSPIKTKSMIRELEIYWVHPSLDPNDKIILCEWEKCDRIIFQHSPKVKNGLLKTGLKADFFPTENLSFTKQCLKYHVAWLRNNTIMNKNCLSTQPNWMADRQYVLRNKTFREIFLPGTHDSAAYSKTKEPGEDLFLDKYIITQDEDVLAQLIYGVRYLDIRVGYYPLKEVVWWANHGIVPLVPLQTVIDQVIEFLNNTQEIVIFDVQEFPVGFGAGPAIHDKLIVYLKKQFKDFLIPEDFTWSNKLQDFWDSGKRLIIGYDNANALYVHDKILRSVTQEWGNVQNIEDLFKYLNNIERHAKGFQTTNPRSAMAELTPKTWDILLDRLNGLRQMAENININITTWYNTLFHDSANIVAVDFIKGTGIIETAIEWNDRRFSECT